MTLKQRLTDDVKAAMREGDADKRNTLRMLLAAIKQTEVDDQTTLDDAGVVAVLTKQAKQRRESIADFEKAGRADMAAEEAAELAVIEAYLPRMLPREAVEAEARRVIAELGVTDAKGMGQVMGQLMLRLQGQADGRLVSSVVRELLQT